MAQSSSWQPRLVPGEPEAFVVSAHCVPGFGWELKVSVRRQFQLWDEAQTCVYSQLTTEELVDVIQAEAWVELLGPD